MSQINSRIGRYRQIELIDQGEFVNTYCARDTRLARNVTIRVSNQKLNRDEQRIFLDQARFIAHQNPQISGVSVIDFTADDNLTYLVLIHHHFDSAPQEPSFEKFFELDLALLHSRWINTNKWILALLLTLQISMFVFIGLSLTKLGLNPLLLSLPIVLLLTLLLMLLASLRRRGW